MDEYKVDLDKIKAGFWETLAEMADDNDVEESDIYMTLVAQSEAVTAIKTLGQKENK